MRETEHSKSPDAASRRAFLANGSRIVVASGDVLLEGQGRGVHWIRAVTLDGNEVRAVLRYKGERLAEPDAAPTVRWGIRALMPSLKDSVIVPARSDLVVQWVADNPGRWFFHCHIEWHMATGMARVIEIG